MKRFIAVVSAASLALALPALAAGQQGGSQSGPAAPSAPKADPKAPITGKWTLSIDPGSGPLQLPVDFKQEGKKVTGSVVGPEGSPAPLEGEYAEGKLTFTVTPPDGSGQQFFFSAALKDDGTMAGSIDFNGQQMSFTLARVKDK
jgi:hypothetical protein